MIGDFLFFGICGAILGLILSLRDMRIGRSDDSE